MDKNSGPVIRPTQITLPDGEVITVDGVAYEGWGYEPGKWYLVIQRDEDGNELWQRRWVIPA